MGIFHTIGGVPINPPIGFVPKGPLPIPAAPGDGKQKGELGDIGAVVDPPRARRV